MKRVLITGLHSYLGISLREYLSKWPDRYVVTQISLRDDAWKQMDFSDYDVLYHAVGIAHLRERPELYTLYDRINRDLAVAVAEKARESGIKQFIFLSTLSVYGADTGVLNEATLEKPVSRYGRSKLEAERQITALENNTFRVMILRPPMVYGCGCKGNFGKLVRLAQRLPVFPRVDNQRSMVYIDNLCEFVRQGIETEQSGQFVPQDATYGNTTQIAQWIAQAEGKHLYVSGLWGLLLRPLFPVVPAVRKAFGTLIYQETAEKTYQIVDQKTGVQRSVHPQKTD